MFYENAKHLRSELVDCLVSVTPQRYDLVEVCCPWDSPLSKAVEQAGGRAFRMGIHNGFDLSTKAGLVKAMAKIRELKPRYVHVSPPCNPWTSLQNACQGHADRMKRLQVKRQHGRRILRNCLKLIQLQRQELDGQTGLASENHAGGEHPLRALSWNEPSMRKMVQLCGGERFRCDGCRFGMYSDKSQAPIQKPWGWFSSSPKIRVALDKQCKHVPGQHAQMTGQEVAATATYPVQLCRAFAKALMKSLGTEVITKTAVYISAEVHEPPQEPEPQYSNQEQLAEPPEHPEEPESGETGPREPEPNWNPGNLEHKIRTIHTNLGHPSKAVLLRVRLGPLLKSSRKPKLLSVFTALEEVTRSPTECHRCLMQSTSGMLLVLIRFGGTVPIRMSKGILMNMLLVSRSWMKLVTIMWQPSCAVEPRSKDPSMPKSSEGVLLVIG